MKHQSFFLISSQQTRSADSSDLLVNIRQTRRSVVFITEFKSSEDTLTLFPPCLYRGHGLLYEKTLHLKSKQPLLNHIYEYFTEAERSAGGTCDETLNHVPIHSSQLFFSLQSVTLSGLPGPSSHSSRRCKSLTPYLSARPIAT